MSIRVIVLVKIGKPFGGFRLAFKAGLLGINNKKAFERLEIIIGHVFDLLANTPFENWENQLNGLLQDESFKKLTGPGYGMMDFLMNNKPEGEAELIIRAFTPHLLSFGGWAVYDGFRLKKDNSSSRIPDDELEEFW